MTPIELLEHIAAGESQTLEFKASFDKASIASLVAFANTQGGTVLVGVTDAAVVQGVTLGKETLNEWLGQIKSATSPSLIPDLAAHSLNGKTVVSIQVAEFPVKPVSTRGRYYKRIASSNHALALNEIADLYLQSLQISWDAHPRAAGQPGRPVACQNRALHTARQRQRALCPRSRYATGGAGKAQLHRERPADLGRHAAICRAAPAPPRPHRSLQNAEHDH
ncbi:ATP-binding protein [Polaromonas sp. P2-4]|nr:ATP-binding protein [Polaromonas sp. P2-4]